MKAINAMNNKNKNRKILNYKILDNIKSNSYNLKTKHNQLDKDYITFCLRLIQLVKEIQKERLAYIQV